MHRHFDLTGRDDTARFDRDGRTSGEDEPEILPEGHINIEAEPVANSTSPPLARTPVRFDKLGRSGVVRVNGRDFVPS